MEHLTSSPLSNNALSEHKIGGCKNQLHLPNLEREKEFIPIYRRILYGCWPWPNPTPSGPAVPQVQAHLPVG